MMRRLRVLERKKKSGIAPIQWNRAEQHVEADVAAHPRHLPFRHAEIARFPGDVAAECRGGDRADAGDKVEHDVEPDRLVDAGDDEHPLEQFLHPSIRWRTDAGSHARLGNSRRIFGVGSIRSVISCPR